MGWLCLLPPYLPAVQVGSPLPGQPPGGGAGEPRRSSAHPAAAPAVYRASEVKGSRVDNARGEWLGTVHEIVIDLQAAQPVFLLVSPVRVPGVSGDLRPVPPGVCSVQETASGIALVLDLPGEQWEEAPAIGENQDIHHLGQEFDVRQVYEFYGRDWGDRQRAATGRRGPGHDDEGPPSPLAAPTVTENDDEGRETGATEPAAVRREVTVTERKAGTDEARRPQREGEGEQGRAPLSSVGPLMLAGDLVDLSVETRMRSAIGEIADVMISIEEAWIPFVLIRLPAPFSQRNQGLYAVSPQSLRVLEEGAILNISQDSLAAAQPLTAENFYGEARDQAAVRPSEAREQPVVFLYEMEDESMSSGGAGGESANSEP